MSRRSGTVIAWLAGVLALTAMACYEPAVREKVQLTIQRDGAIRLEVDTLFRQGAALQEKDREEIRRTLDLYALGRDPWLRGLARAGARDIAHERRGTDEAPEQIRRQATLPSVEALVQVMPDAIANFRLQRDDGDGATTLRIVPIDVPASIRENRRKLEKEVAAIAAVLRRFADRQCDLYDYLAERPDRRLAVLQALVVPGAIDQTITPEETALVERFGQALEAMSAWTGAGRDVSPDASQAASQSGGDETPAIARLSFSAFEHDFCVSLPSDPIAVDGFVKEEDADKKTLWCLERLEAGEIVDRAGPACDPPLSSFDDGLPADSASLAALPFTCRRYEDDREVQTRLWEEMLPRPLYELRWSSSDPTPAASSSPRPGS